MAVDSLGNVWVTNKLGNSERGRLKMLGMAVAGKINFYGNLMRPLEPLTLADRLPSSTPDRRRPLMYGPQETI